MKETIKAICIALAFLAFLSFEGVAFAANKDARLLKRVARLQAKLDRRIARLSAADVKKLSTVKARSLNDSDGDGANDLIESGLNTDMCDQDTDNDGLEDGDEVEEEECDPLDGEDGSEVAGFIILLSEDTIEVDSMVARVDEDTSFEDENGEEIDIESFTLGTCVTLEGFLNDENELIAHDVIISEDAAACTDEEEEENSCEDDDSDDDDESEEEESDDDDDSESEEENEEGEDDDDDTEENEI